MGIFKHVSLTLPALVLAAGCTTMYGTVLPQANGNYEVITAGKSKGSAMKAAQSDAENTCKKATGNKRFVSFGTNSEFTGVSIDRGEGGTTRSVIASAVEFAAKLENDTNYDVQMTFRCVADGREPAASVQPVAASVYAPAPVVPAQASVATEAESPAAKRARIEAMLSRAATASE